jgi:hypothetical protein
MFRRAAAVVTVAGALSGMTFPSISDARWDPFGVGFIVHLCGISSPTRNFNILRYHGRMLDEKAELATNARRAERLRTLIGAVAHFNEGRSSADCQIKNLSSTGARLSLSPTLPLPHEFLLQIPSRNQTYNVEVRWRKGEAVGVKFQRSVVSGEEQAIFEMTLEELRTEVTVLRRQRAELLTRLADLGHSEVQDGMIRKLVV